MLDPVLLNRQRTYPVQTPRLRDFINRVRQRLDLHSSEFSVWLTNDRKVRSLNSRFRHKDGYTDVLSFPNLPGETEPGLDLSYLGDIIISVPTAHRQARAGGHGLERELRILIIHGVLHLLGYDHETDRGKMRRKELKLRKELL
jgi:probable rRNA maturation factor